jgi:UDP-3-O-[3-hydroxymyristoyl] glucosamine N-acyltransferase
MIHPTAEVSPQAEVGEGTRIWHQAQVRERARIGRDCIISKGVYIDFDVVIGDSARLPDQ